MSAEHSSIKNDPTEKWLDELANLQKLDAAQLFLKQLLQNMLLNLDGPDKETAVQIILEALKDKTDRLFHPPMPDSTYRDPSK